MQASHALKKYAHAYAQAAAEVVAESLWPTRCVVCGALGEVLCSSCVAQLPFIDQARACPRCGAPFGQHQCCECNSFSLKGLGRSCLPFNSCVSAVHYSEDVARIVRARKDHDERRLARVMAFYIACAIPPAWVEEPVVLVPVPGTVAALRRRGFDHGLELVKEVGQLLDLPVKSVLRVAQTQDQRGLGRQLRAQNVSGRFSVQGEGASHVPARVILVDDVYTTGSTVMAATDALREAGAAEVFVASFARV